MHVLSLLKKQCQEKANEAARSTKPKSTRATMEKKDQKKLKKVEEKHKKKLFDIEMELFKIMGELHDDPILEGKGKHLAFRLKGASVIVEHVRELIKYGIN